MDIQQWMKDHRRTVTVVAIIIVAAVVVTLAVMRTAVGHQQAGGGQTPDAVAVAPSGSADAGNDGSAQPGNAASGDKRQQTLDDLDRIRSLKGAGVSPGELELAGRAATEFLKYSSQETDGDRAARVTGILEDAPSDKPSIAATVLGRQGVQILRLQGQVTNTAVCDVSDYRKDGVVDAEVCVTVSWQAHVSMKDGTGLAEHTESGEGTWIVTVPYERSVTRALTLREPSSADMTWSMDR